MHDSNPVFNAKMKLASKKLNLAEHLGLLLFHYIFILFIHVYFYFDLFFF